MLKEIWQKLFNWKDERRQWERIQIGSHVKYIPVQDRKTPEPPVEIWPEDGHVMMKVNGRYYDNESFDKGTNWSWPLHRRAYPYDWELSGI